MKLQSCNKIFLDTGHVPPPLTVGSKLSLYADDMLLYKPIRVDVDYVDLQSDIDSLYN